MENKPIHIVSPLIFSPSLSKIAGRKVFLKLDNIQPSGSFKIRGIGHHIQKSVSERGCKRLVSSSGGNAGMAAAWAGRELNLPTTIVLPSTTPQFMKEKLMSMGADVLEFGSVWDQAHQEAQRICAGDSSAALIHPFDHPEIWEGHTTIISEIFEQIEKKPVAIMCSVGGGGLMLGVLKGLQRVGWTDVTTIALETEGAESFGQCLKQGKWVKLDRIDSIAKSLGALQVAEEAYHCGVSSKLKAATVTDKETVQAIEQFLDDHRILTEPACAATLAALYSERVRNGVLEGLEEDGPIVVIVCGGSVINMSLLESFKNQF